MTKAERAAYMRTWRKAHPEQREKQRILGARWAAKQKGNLEHEQRLRDAQRRYRERHPERVKAQMKRWREAHQEHIKAYEHRPDQMAKARSGSRAYYAAHVEERCAYSREWYATNYEDHKPIIYERVRRWQRAHPEKKLQYQHQRRAAQKGVPVVERFSPTEIYERDSWICQLCGTPADPLADVFGDRPTLDHIVPLVRGGEHSRANVQLAHHRCNARKGHRLAA